MTRRIALLVLIAVAIAGVAPATTYVVPPDEALVRQADTVAQVEVLAVEPAPIAGPPATDVFVQIERVLKGYVPGSTVVVRVPGGIGPDGRGLRIWGAPRFREGDRAILFLSPRDDGTYGILHLMLGAFVETESRGQRVATRTLSEATDVSPRSRSKEGHDGAVEPLRLFDEFVEWIAATAAGETEAPDYLLLSAEAPRLAHRERPGQLEDVCTQSSFRWFEADRGEGIPWHLYRLGFDGRGAGRRALDRARKAWFVGSGGALRLTRGGRTGSDAGFSSFDGRNTVLFGDPNDLMSGAFSCRAGGIVSVAGVWFDNGRGQDCSLTGSGRRGKFRGRRFLEVVGADVVTNDGAACLFRGDAALTAQVLAHEIGHSLGLSHSTALEALMAGGLREPRSGDLVRAADRAALRVLYRIPAAGSRR